MVSQHTGSIFRQARPWIQKFWLSAKLPNAGTGERILIEAGLKCAVMIGALLT